jgi:hypothetical protein
MQSKSTIRDLINSKCLELNISYKELIIKSKYSNVSVGLKRLNQLFNHNYQASAGLIEKLPLALNISVTDINQAIICSKIEQKTEQDKTDRLLFKPNVLVRTEQSCKPKQIYIAAILNANQYITQELPDALAISEYKNYAMNFYHLNIERIKAFFYAPIDIVINYSFEYSELISLTGNHIEYLNKHERAGELTYEI